MVLNELGQVVLMYAEVYCIKDDYRYKSLYGRGKSVEIYHSSGYIN